MADQPPDLLLQLGIKLPDLLAGFGGGVVNALALKRSDPWSIITSVMIGGIMANYMAETFGRWAGTTQQVSGFLVGVGGMALAQGLIAAVSRWSPQIGPNRTAPDVPKSNP